MNTVDRFALLELDIDARLTSIWAEIPNRDTFDLPTVAALMRAAYGAGYCAALREPVRGQLLRDHGYPRLRREQP